ncbi:hypothetical protein G6F64_014171 [Rhizopus arrhizus]|uniref:Uncharacterized protein n=1 Tax=Rhizopus oryzae TaxID=64495 RepID=A0A9P6WTX3_RHIOR|nr:hypothetical protein G6F64_014171 [Rhizopus arrhizus]
MGGVVRRGRRLAAIAVAAQVRGHARAVPRQFGPYAVPDGMRLRMAVQQQQRRPRPVDARGDFNAIALDAAHGQVEECGHGYCLLLRLLVPGVQAVAHRARHVLHPGMARPVGGFEAFHLGQLGQRRTHHVLALREHAAMPFGQATRLPPARSVLDTRASKASTSAGGRLTSSRPLLTALK